MSRRLPALKPRQVIRLEHLSGRMSAFTTPQAVTMLFEMESNGVLPNPWLGRRHIGITSSPNSCFVPGA
jgi:hypothetical protein